MTTTAIDTASLLPEITDLSNRQIKVANDQDMTEAAELLARFRKKRKEVEEQFEVPIKGLKSEVKQLQDQRDKLVAPLTQAEGRLQTEILGYRSRVAAEAAAQQAKLNAQHEKKVEKAIAKGKDLSEIAPPVQVALPAKSVITDAGGVTARKVKKFRIADPSLVPKDYWIIDESMVGKAVRAGLEIPGVQTWEEEVLSVR